MSLSIVTQVCLLHTSAALTGTVTVNGQAETRTASGSFLAPLPILGPRVRWYPLAQWPIRRGRIVSRDILLRLRSFMTARGTGDLSLSRNWRLNLGDQMSTRLRIDTGTNEIGIRLTQKGPVAGLEPSW
jgi:hypothetical protein